MADVYSLLKDNFKDILQEPMEAELNALSELGSGAESADRPVWREAYPVSVKEKTGTPHSIKRASQSYAINTSSIA